MTAAAHATLEHTPGRKKGKGYGQQEYGPLHSENAPSGFSRTHWVESGHKANPSCKGAGKRAFLPGALLLQTAVVFSGKRRRG